MLAVSNLSFFKCSQPDGIIILAHEFYYAKLKLLPSTLCQNIVVKDKNSISSCFHSHPNVCMIDTCIVCIKIKINMFKSTLALL